MLPAGTSGGVRTVPLLKKEASNSRLRYLGSTESLPAGLNCESCGGFDGGTAGTGLFPRAQCPRGCLWNQGPKRNFNGLGILRRLQWPHGCINEQFKRAGKAASGCVEVWNRRPCHPRIIGGEAIERQVAVILDLKSTVGEISREGPGELETDLLVGFFLRFQPYSHED